MGNRASIKGNKTAIKAIALVFLTCTLFAFQNCGSKDSADGDVESQSSKIFCGFEGFAHLHKHYFYPQCAGCHEQGGISFPPFADKDVEYSYRWARSIASETMYKSSTENRFCLDTCNLHEGEELYDDLVTWLDCKDDPVEAEE